MPHTALLRRSQTPSASAPLAGVRKRGRPPGSISVKRRLNKKAFLKRTALRLSKKTGRFIKKASLKAVEAATIGTVASLGAVAAASLVTSQENRAKALGLQAYKKARRRFGAKTVRGSVKTVLGVPSMGQFRRGERYKVAAESLRPMGRFGKQLASIKRRKGLAFEEGVLKAHKGLTTRQTASHFRTSVKRVEDILRKHGRLKAGRRTGFLRDE